MKKVLFLVVVITVLCSFPFSCEKPEINPIQDAQSVQETNTSPSLIGSWVLCGVTYEYNAIPGVMGDFKDTVRFSSDGNFVYVCGDYYEDGSSRVYSHFYESTKRYLVLFDSNNEYDYHFGFYEFALIENGTQLLVFDWSSPRSNSGVLSNCRFRKID